MKINWFRRTPRVEETPDPKADRNLVAEQVKELAGHGIYPEGRSSDGEIALAITRLKEKDTVMFHVGEGGGNRVPLTRKTIPRFLAILDPDRHPEEATPELRSAIEQMKALAAAGVAFSLPGHAWANPVEICRKLSCEYSHEQIPVSVPVATHYLFVRPCSAYAGLGSTLTGVTLNNLKDLSETLEAVRRDQSCSSGVALTPTGGAAGENLPLEQLTLQPVKAG